MYTICNLNVVHVQVYITLNLHVVSCLIAAKVWFIFRVSGPNRIQPLFLILLWSHCTQFVI